MSSNLLKRTCLWGGHFAWKKYSPHLCLTLKHHAIFVEKRSVGRVGSLCSPKRIGFTSFAFDSYSLYHFRKNKQVCEKDGISLLAKKD